MSNLLDWQRSFIDAMHRPQATPPQLGHKAGLDVYRNNIRSSLIEALKEAFPHTLTLLGERCFSAEAARFVATSPPEDPRLSRYGQGFARRAQARTGACALSLRCRYHPARTCTASGQSRSRGSAAQDVRYWRHP